MIEETSKGYKPTYCAHCKEVTDHEIVKREDDEGHEDFKFICEICGHGFWIEDPDS